jgi:hypothetical protein
MMQYQTLADVSLNFFGQHGFAWWAAVVAAAGITLLYYAWRQWHSARSAKPDTAPPPSASPLQTSSVYVPAVAGLIAIAYAVLAWLLPAAQKRLPAMVITAALLILAVWIFYRRVYQFLGRRRVLALLALRSAGLIFLLLMMFKPAIAWVTIPHRLVKIGMVIDTSGSMSVSDQPNAPSRYLQSVLAVRQLSRIIHQHFQIQYFAYDGIHNAPLTSEHQYSSIAPDGDQTDLPTAIKLATDNGDKEVVLFSDGIQNGPTPLRTLSHLGAKVYTVRVGSTATHAKGVPEIDILRVDGPQSAPVNTRITLTVHIRSTALDDRTVQVQLLRHHTLLKSHQLVLQSGAAGQVVKLHVTPHHVGRLLLTVHIPPVPQERSTAGNTQQFPILITNPRISVLYIEAQIRPEVGPLEQDLATDPNVNLVSLIQTRPGYFMVRGMQGKLTALPQSLAQWKQFKVIILGDVAANFFSPAQRQQIRETVQAGAGFLMIGGMQNFASGGWGNTSMASLFPIRLDTVHPSQLSRPFVPELTPFGRQSPIFSGIAQWFIPPGGGQPSRALPDLDGCVAFAGLTPSGQSLLIDPKEKVNGAPAIVLAVGHYGKGRSAAFAADTTYRWQLELRTMGNRSPYHRFWGQLIRWLAGQSKIKTASGPSVTALIRRQRYRPGQVVRLRAQVTDMSGQSTRFAHTKVVETLPDGKSRSLFMNPQRHNIGMYKRNIRPTLPGKYTLTFSATKGGKLLGTDKTDIYVMPPQTEMTKLAAEPAILKRIARLTGGTFSELDSIGALGRRLNASLPRQNQIRRVSVPLYDNTLCFVLFITAISAEWLLRRKWQLQ